MEAGGRPWPSPTGGRGGVEPSSAASDTPWLLKVFQRISSTLHAHRLPRRGGRGANLKETRAGQGPGVRQPPPPPTPNPDQLPPNPLRGVRNATVEPTAWWQPSRPMFLSVGQ